MRILHVIPYYRPAIRYGGPIVSVHELCRALAAKGHAVSVFTTSIDAHADSDVPLKTPVMLDGVAVTYFGSKLFRRLFWAPALSGALRRQIKNFDVVHTHTTYLWPTFAAARAARQASVPYVFSPRGMLVKDLITRRSRMAKRAWIALMERRNAADAAAIHVTSEIEADELRKFGWRLPAISTIANGVADPEGVISNQLSSDVTELEAHDPFVLWFGRINWKKRLELLLDAWAGTQTGTLVIAGPDEEGSIASLRQRAAERGIAHRVRFLPRMVTGSDREFLLQRACCLALPSLSENFGNVVVEAMRRSVPVVVSAQVGAAEIVKASGAGLVVEAGVASWTAALNAVLADIGRRTQMGAAGQQHVIAHYTWPKIATQMEALYDSVTRRG